MCPVCGMLTSVRVGPCVLGPRGPEGYSGDVHLGQIRNQIVWEMRAFAIDSRNAIFALQPDSNGPVGGLGYAGPDGVMRPDTVCMGWRGV